MMAPHRLLFSVLGSCLLALPTLAAADTDGHLKSGDEVAIVGDSITEQRLYSMFVEDYLLMCKPAPDLRVTQFGWGGETAPQFLARMDNDLLPFHPTVVTTCYGMNDGEYSPMTPEKRQRYAHAQKAIIDNLKADGVRLIVLGSPSCVDTTTFRNSSGAADMYNRVLAEETNIDRQLAEAEGVAFADIHDPMMDVMAKAKDKYFSRYTLAGPDGVHPNRDGHLVMAYALLKALGCDGDIGTITVDLAKNTAQATDGHQILGMKNGVVQVQSSKYPFCFYGDPNSSDSTTGVIEFFPFNQDLNRFRLVVTGAPASKLMVTWGPDSKVFSAADLAKGINLAAEFIQNPFSKPFHDVEVAVANQQTQETQIIKGLVHTIPDFERHVPQDSKLLTAIVNDLVQRDQALQAASAQAVKPVTYTISITPVEGR